MPSVHEQVEVYGRMQRLGTERVDEEWADREVTC